MLLAKLKDKLFNNRNSVEVESLEGDLNGISLQDCLEWAESLREYIFYDTEEDVIMVDFGTLFTDYVMFTGGLAHLTDEDGNHLFPTGKVPNIWTSSSTFDHIGDIDFDKVKDGDIIFAKDENLTAVYSGIVEGYEADNSFRIKVLYSSKVSFYYYQKEDDYWDYVSTSDTTFAGTQLYLHTWVYNSITYYAITDFNTPFNQISGGSDIGNAMTHCYKLWEISNSKPIFYTLGIQTTNTGFKCFYMDGSSNDIQVKMFYPSNATSDTVTKI